MEEEKQLQQLGLTDKEAKLYLNALELGTFSVAGIAHRSGLKRPTCYLILEELSKKGLVSINPKAKKTLYVVESPEILLKQSERNVLLSQKLVPKLNALHNTEKEKAVVKYYSGIKGIHNIYEDVLKCKNKKYNLIGSAEEIVATVGKEFIDNWLETRIQKNISAKSIKMKSTEIPNKLYQSNILRECRYSPKDIFIAETIFIYDDKTAIVSTKKGNFGFIIESREFADTMTGLFKALWKISTPDTRNSYSPK